MTRLARIGLAIALLSAALAAFLVFRKDHAPKPSARDVPWLDGAWIRYSPGFAERAKLSFAEPEEASLSPVVSVTGTVTFDPERVAAVGARIPGRVRRVLKFPGDRIASGDPLCELESADLGEAQASVVAARAHLEAATANELREAQLAESRVSSQRDAELAHATAAAARAELRATEQRQRALGGASSTEIGVVRIESPIAGKLVESNVSRGQSVEPSTTLFRVANLEQLWIELAVFERDLGRVHLGDDVDLSPQTNQSATVRGKVGHVGDVIDLETRTSSVRVTVRNEGDLLRPGQSVLAKIHTRGEAGARIVVPREAVTSVDGRPTVFVAHDATSVESRTIVLGAHDASRIEVSSGLSLHERVAVAGVFALKSELFR